MAAPRAWLYASLDHVNHKTPLLARGQVAVWRNLGDGWRDASCHVGIIQLLADLRVLQELGGLVTSSSALPSHPFDCEALRASFHHVTQILSLQLTQRVTRRFEVIRQLLRESLVEGGVFLLMSAFLTFS